MSVRAMRVSLGILCPLVVIQVAVQYLQRGVGWEGAMLPWPDDRTAQTLVVALLSVAVALIAGYAAFRQSKGAKGSWGAYMNQVASGFPPTAPLLIPIFALAVLVMRYSPVFESVDSTEKALLAALVASLAVWTIAAVWRGMQSTAKGAAPALYERLRTDYLALEAMIRQMDAERRGGNSAPRSGVTIGTSTSVPTSTDGPLPDAEIPGYLSNIGTAMGFGAEHAPSVSNWNSGAGYLEMQRRLNYVRDSLIDREEDQQRLGGQVNTLELRLAGSHLPEATRTLLKQQLDDERKRFVDATDSAIRGPVLYVIAATLSSYTYDRQRALLQLQSQQHWLVVLTQIIAGAVLSIAVLAGASREAIAAAIVFFLVGAASGIISLLQVRQSSVDIDLGEDYGLFRVELARAFTLSGMAAVLAVLLIANLPVLAGAGVFDPPSVTEAPGPETPGSTPLTGMATPVSDDEAGSSIAQPVRAFSATLFLPVAMQAQDTTVPAQTDPQDAVDETDPASLSDADSEEDASSPGWRPLRDIYAFTNLGGLLVALLAGWVPERLFRTLTDYGNRLRLDIQSVSKSSV